MLDNGLVACVVDGRGLIVSLRRPRDRPRGDRPPARAATCCSSTATLPNQWDAWDVDEHYLRVATDLTGVDAITVARGPRTASLTIERSFGASR